MSHSHNSIFNEHKQDKATGKKDFAYIELRNVEAQKSFLAV